MTSSWLRRMMFTVCGSIVVGAAPVEASTSQADLLPIYKASQQEFEVPWYLLAAIDRYAQMTKSKADRDHYPFYGFGFRETAWAGIDNPDPWDVNPTTIKIFHGLGVDGNHDGLAFQWEQEDRIKGMARWLDYLAGEDTETAIWNLFQDPVAMERIEGIARIFHTFGLSANGHCFPLSKRYNYSVKYSFGAGRSWGGRRVHEGVDIFADYGTPALACSYGYVELLGWNRFGGWRIGIRDANNVYYYYAHLSSFAKGIKQGDLVRPGQVIGYVGSTGYGPPGTSGKFPPHLHFGMYRDTGRHEWAFSPSGPLHQWERQKQTVIQPTKSS